MISAWKNPSQIGSEISLLQRDFLFLLKAAQANCFLLQMSSLFPNKLPKYLHFFHSGFEVLLMLYSSVFIYNQVFVCEDSWYYLFDLLNGIFAGCCP